MVALMIYMKGFKPILNVLYCVMVSYVLKLYRSIVIVALIWKLLKYNLV